MRGVRDPDVVVELVLRGEREPGAVGVAVDVVGLERIEALLHAHAHPRRHDRRQHPDLADVEPLLARPAVRAPLHRRRERRVVGPEILRAAEVDVADDLRSVRVQRGDGRGRIVEPVDVEHLHAGVGGHRSLQLPVPADRRRRRRSPVRAPRRGMRDRTHPNRAGRPRLGTDPDAVPRRDPERVLLAVGQPGDDLARLLGMELPGLEPLLADERPHEVRVDSRAVDVQRRSPPDGRVSVPADRLRRARRRRRGRAQQRHGPDATWVRARVRSGPAPHRLRSRTQRDATATNDATSATHDVPTCDALVRMLSMLTSVAPVGEMRGRS